MRSNMPPKAKKLFANLVAPHGAFMNFKEIAPGTAFVPSSGGHGATDSSQAAPAAAAPKKTSRSSTASVTKRPASKSTPVHKSVMKKHNKTIKKKNK